LSRLPLKMSRISTVNQRGKTEPFSLTLATQEVIDRKLEMRVDALEEAIMHIGTELQALKVKMALSCHAD